MKKILNLLIPMLTGALLLVSCKQDDTTGFTLYGFNPNPAERGELISFYGEGLDAVTTVVFAGGAETSEITRNGSSISVVIPMEAQPGYIELRFPGGSYTTRSALTLEEPLAADAQLLSYTDFEHETNAVTTVGSKLYIVTAAETDYLTDIVRVEFEGDDAVVVYDADATAAAEEELADGNDQMEEEEYLLALSERVDFVRGAHLLIVTIPQSARSGAVSLYNTNEDRFEAQSVEIAQSAAGIRCARHGRDPRLDAPHHHGRELRTGHFGRLHRRRGDRRRRTRRERRPDGGDRRRRLLADGPDPARHAGRSAGAENPLGEVIATPAVETVVPTNLSAWSEGDLFKAGKAMTLSCNDTEDDATNYEILKQVEKVLLISGADAATQTEATFSLNDDYRCLDLTAPDVCGARAVAIVTYAGKQQTVIDALGFAAPSARRTDDAELHAGDAIPLTGEHLDLIAKASLNGVACEIDRSSETEMVVTIAPTCTSGDLILQAVDPTYSITLPLTLLPTGRIAVTALPGNAAAGAEITVEGSGFNLVESLLIGGTKVIAYSFRSDTQLTFTVPEETPAGTYPLTFNLTNGTSETSAQQITIGAAPAQETVLWEGSVDTGSWNGQTVEASLFASLTADMTYTLYFETPYETGAQLTFKNPGDWTALLSATPSDPEWGCYTIQSGETSYSFQLSAEDLAKVQANGMYLSGQKVVITKFVVAAQSAEGSDPAGETVLTEDPKVLPSGWGDSVRLDSDMGYDVSVFADCTTQTLFTIHLADLGATPQLKIVDKNWTTLPSANLPQTDWGGVDLASGQETFTFSLDETDLEKVKSSGMIISGQDVTVTKVTMKN